MSTLNTNVFIDRNEQPSGQPCEQHQGCEQVDRLDA